VQEVLICLVPVDKIPYVDHPEIKVSENERTEMPFRYVTNDAGAPIMPEVSA
jgi:ribosome biogenesis SPOUT family RNA methylase Rps3